MALDTATFSLKMIDGMSGPAKKSARSMDQLQDEIRQTEKALLRLSKTEQKAARAGFKGTQRATRQRRKEMQLRLREMRMQVRHQRQIDRVAAGRGGTTALAGILGGMAATAAIGTVAAVGAGTTALAGRAIETEATIAALERLDKTGRGGVAIFNEIREQAKMFGLDIDKTAHSYAAFLKLQFPDNEAKKWVALGADMQALGNSADDVQGIFRAIGQIRSKGRLQAEEMLQLSERGVSRDLVNEEIAAIMGVDKDAEGAWRQAVAKLQEKGKVTWDIASRAIEQALNRKLKQQKAGESAKQFADNQLKGVINVAKARAQDFWITLGQRAEPGLAKGLASLTDGIAKFAESDRGVRLIEQLGIIAENVGSGLEKIGEWAPKAADAFLAGFEKTSGLLGESTDSGNRFQNFLDRSIPALETFGENLGTVANVLDRVLSLMDSIAGFSIGGVNVLDFMQGNMDLVTGTALIKGAAKVLPANDNGGIVTGMSGGVATVKAAPGEGLASIGVGETIVPANARMGGNNIGDINVSIIVEGSQEPEAVAAATMAEFESKLNTVFNGAMG